MELTKELQRISKIINDMSINEFEEMLFDCGLGTIRHSEQSDFTNCLRRDFFVNKANYVFSKNQVFLPDDYKDFYDFNDLGQGVA